MIKYDYILFDLDGTISKSAEGIRKSLEEAILTMNKPLPNLDDYTLYIGPPLIDTFLNLCKFSMEDSLKASELYRNYYNTKGKYINTTYDGVTELLKKIKEENKKVAVCSSKYEKFAEEIIEILGLTDYFDVVCGSNLDGSRKDKKDLIPYAIKRLGGNAENDLEKCVMIGDTFFDTKGAVEVGVDFIGVKYGYGDVDEMVKNGAKVFANTPLEIFDLL